ncbi:hypothetical protein GCM10027168_73990 [Streptomyces capparidis]
MRVTVALAGEAVVCLPLWVAEHDGHLAAEGITTRHAVTGSTDAVTTALRNGDADFALSTPEGTVIDAVHGGTLRVLAGLTNHPPLSLVAQAEHRSVADLRGRPIGTSSLTEGTRHLAEAVLARYGLYHPRDYSFVLVGNHAERWRLLRRGELAAALQPVPFAWMAEDAGFTVLTDVRDHIPDYPFVAVCADAASPVCRQAAPGFLRALRAGARAFLAEPGRWSPLAARVMGVPRRYTDRAVRELDRAGLVDAELRLSPEALRTAVGLLRRAALLPPAAGRGTLAPEQAVDPRWLEGIRRPERAVGRR